MKVLIFSGGSGSDDLQKGLYKSYPELDITVLLNAYDNGKSTGAIRQVYSGNILGPSDVRKNQTRHFMLKHGKTNVYDFIEHRFTSDAPESYIDNYYNSLEKSETLDVLYEIVKTYFKDHRSNTIEYVDFSIGNIIYGALSSHFNNSLQTAADYMHDLLNIDQKTVLNSDESLFLQAIVKDGSILYDEADIVEYANEDSPIVDIRFLTSDGKEKDCSFLCQKAIDAIDDTDLIIFSSGTQWSSLIPTYKCKTANGKSFREIISSSNAKKMFIVNGEQDKDMHGLNGDDILNVVDSYFNVSECDIISGDTAIRPLDTECYVADFGSAKYDGKLLADFLISLYFKQATKNDTFVFDFDDTIQGRKGTFIAASSFNKQNLPTDSHIITGNSHHKVNIDDTFVYADGGINLYYNKKFIRCLDESLKIDRETVNLVMKFMTEYGLNMSLLQNRNDSCLTIKPIPNEFRKMLVKLLNDILDSQYEAKLSGTTSVDIMNIHNNKMIAIKDILKSKKNDRLFYIGDELYNGNDKIIEDNKEKYDISTIAVNNPADTALFIRSVIDKS